MRVTEKQAREYFENMIQYQPETVAELLMNLFSRKENVDVWIGNIANDIIDSEG